MEANVTTVRDIYLADTLCRSDIHHLYLVGAVDDGIKLRAIYLQVVAHVAHLFRHRGIGVAIDIASVDT